MQPDALMGATMRMNASMEALVALGAYLRSQTEQIDVHPAIAAQLREVAAVAAGGDVDATPGDARRVVANAIRTLFLQAGDLLEHPERPPGWVDPDPRVLQSTGRASAAVALVMESCGLTAGLDRPGAAFLDVGIGVGWIAITVAQRHPTARVVGIDVFAPALALARANVADSALADQIELRHQSVADLADDGAFDLIWLPGPFLGRETMIDAIARSARALRSGGTLVAGLYGGPPDPLSQALTNLRAVRSGGHPWAGPDLVGELTAAGLHDAHEVERTWQAPVRLVVGRK